MNRSGIPNQCIRSAEAARKSSCEFANAVATASIEKYKEVTPPILQQSYKQTVMSSFLVHNSDNNELYVIAFGVGTKFMTWKSLLCRNTDLHIDADGSHSKYINTVHDCHAEILARRGLLQYIYNSISIVLDHVESSTLDQLPQDIIFDYNPPNHSTNSNALSDRSNIFQCFVLKPQYSIHFYTSSQPCGNASWKNWGKSRTTVFSENEGDSMKLKIPLSKHPVFHCSAIEEGQVECLVKRDHSYTAALDCTAVDMNHGQFKEPPSGTSFPFHVDVGAPNSGSNLGVTNKNSEFKSNVEAGVSTGVIMTCSDKIAKWCNVGVQGSLLSYLVYSNKQSGSCANAMKTTERSGIYIDTITVGRKYSETHLQRAVCCRTRSFQYPGAVSYCVHHPTTMCTSVKFDTGVIVTDVRAETELEEVPRDEVETNSDGNNELKVGANFQEARCAVFWKPVATYCNLNSNKQANFEVIDGNNGIVSDYNGDSGPTSKLAPLSFLKRFASIWNRLCSLHCLPHLALLGVEQSAGDITLHQYMSLKSSIGLGVDAITNPYWFAKEQLCHSNIRSGADVTRTQISEITDDATLGRNGDVNIGKSSKISRKTGKSYKSIQKKCMHLNMYTSVKKQLLETTKYSGVGLVWGK